MLQACRRPRRPAPHRAAFLGRDASPLRLRLRYPDRVIPPFAIHSKRNVEKLLYDFEERRKYRFLISIGDPEERPPRGYRLFDGPKIRLHFDDVTKTHYGQMASVVDVQRIIDFCTAVDGPTLIHCYAGISRSSAAACILATIKLGPGRELEALQHVENWSKSNSWCGESIIYPNKHILNLADQLLERQGNLLKAAFTIWEQAADAVDLVEVPARTKRSARG